MFNVFSYDQKLKDRTLKETEAVRAVKQRQKNVFTRNKLNENYERRISQFIINMINEPIKVKMYQRPLQTAGRTSDPSKFKGQAHLILKGYKSEKQRQEEAEQTNQFLSSVPLNFTEKWREREEDKELNERMYFKPRSNFERVKDELMQRHIDITEFGDAHKKIEKKEKLRNSVSSHEDGNMMTKDEPLKPKEIFASLHRKTYFKGVKSILSQSTTSLNNNITLNAKLIHEIKDSLKPRDLKPQELPLLAIEALKSCNVQTTTSDSYLKVGHGKLVSNPDTTIIETYEMLNKITK